MTRRDFFEQNVNMVLKTHGKRIWGIRATREWLLKASNGKEEYTRNLVYEDKTDREVYEKILTLCNGSQLTQNIDSRRT